MSATRGADLLVQSLKAAGVTRIFSLSGNQIMPVYDACLDAGVEIIHTRHEGAAVFMAEAYAQLTGTVGVALVTAGGGIGNAVGALFSARASDTPLVLLSGDSPRAQDGWGAFQELDQTSMTASSTKLSLRPARAGDLGQDTARAIRYACEGRPGPVHMALPVDLLEADVAASPVPPPLAFLPAQHAPSEDACDAIRAAVARAERPLILSGPVMNATRSPGLLQSLERALGAPCFAMESPRGLKDPALGEVAAVLGQADLVICLGKAVDFTLGFGAPKVSAPGCRWIVVNADAAERDRACRNLGDRLAILVDAEPRATARTLAQGAVADARRRDWSAEVHRRLAARSYDAPPDPAEASGEITPAMLCAAVQRQLDGAKDTILICDGGEFGQWTQAALHGDRRIVNGVSGVIGGCLPYALGARMAAPDAVIVTLMGDGTAGFHLPEFETAARNALPFVAVIGNDRRWNAEYQIQLREYGKERAIGVGLSDARYDQAAEALGGHGEHVTRPDQLDAALARAFASGKPACVNVEIEGVPAPSGGH